MGGATSGVRSHFAQPFFRMAGRRFGVTGSFFGGIPMGQHTMCKRLKTQTVVAVLSGLATVSAAFAADVVSVDGQPALIAPLAGRSLLLDGVSVADRHVVVGERGHLLISDDGGHSWKQAAIPAKTMLTGVWFHDTDTGWAVGHDTLILRTKDGGASWEETYSDPDDERPLFDVWFDDASKGFAVGAYGLFMQTMDGGATWDIQLFDPVEFDPESDLDDGADAATSTSAGDDSGAGQSGDDESGDDDWEDDIPFDYHLNHIVEAPNGMLYIAAEAGHFFRSRDRGQSWQSMPTPYEGSFFGALPLSGDALLVFGMRGNLFRSDDAGASWQIVDSGTQASLNQGAILGDGRIVIAGMQGVLLVSADDGNSFSMLRRPDRKHVSGALPAGDAAAVVFGEAGVHRLNSQLESDSADR